MTFSDQYAGDFHGLLKHFIANVTGYVVYDPHTDSTNAALIRCAAEPGNVIAVASAATAKLLDAAGVKMVANVSASNPYDEFMSQRSRLNNRMACFQPDDGGKAQSLSDYAVFARIPTVEDHSGGSKAFSAVLDNFNKTHINAGLGWTSWDEHQWVSHITKAGGYAHASDFANNLAFLTNVDIKQTAPNSKTITATATTTTANYATAANKVHTVAFVTSDGDNIQLLEHEDFIGTHFFGSADRGNVPVGWSFSPAMAVLMPTVLDYVRSSLTVNDSLSAGPSGAGE
jgi:hypothetical protein